MIRLTGKVTQGVKHFTLRMTNFANVFQAATGEQLFRGTLNVDVGRPVAVKEHFRIRGKQINEPDQDLLFEICRANGLWAYRIRPYHLITGQGGHGDHVFEIACSQKIPNATTGMVVNIELFRDVP